MCLLVSLFLVASQLAGFTPPKLLRTATFEHPPNLVGISLVIAKLEIDSDGSVRRPRMLTGLSPFTDIVLSTIRHWQFTPARSIAPENSQATAVFLFRPRQSFSGAEYRYSRRIPGAQDQPPIPILLSDPGYPINSLGEGTVVLELSTSPAGQVENVRTVRDEPGLGTWTAKTVVHWQFASAMRSGVPVPGTVVVAVSYLRPFT